MIIQQENGLYCVYSKKYNTFVLWDATKQDLFLYLLNWYIPKIIQDIKKIHNSSIIPELVEKSREIHKTDPRVLADIEKFTQDIGSNESVEATDLTTDLVNLLIRYLEEEDDLDLEEFKKLMES